MSDRYAIHRLPAQQIGEIQRRTYDHDSSLGGTESWLVVTLGGGAGELSFAGPGGADLADEIAEALMEGAAELRARIKNRGGNQ